jgi:hypothetical protein
MVAFCGNFSFGMDAIAVPSDRITITEIAASLLSGADGLFAINGTTT